MKDNVVMNKIYFGGGGGEMLLKFWVILSLSFGCRGLIKTVLESNVQQAYFKKKKKRIEIGLIVRTAPCVYKL